MMRKLEIIYYGILASSAPFFPFPLSSYPPFIPSVTDGLTRIRSFPGVSAVDRVGVPPTSDAPEAYVVGS